MFGNKRPSPVDRAVEDVDRQIVALQKQLRQLSADGAARGPSSLADNSTAPLPSPATAAVKYIKELLTPPNGAPLVSSHRSRHDLFDISVEPLKDLEAEPIAFSRKTEPDLFAKAQESAKRDGQGEGVPGMNNKLMHYLSAGSIKTYKPLKHVQRQVRNRFFMWLGLSLVALWLLYAVIR